MRLALPGKSPTTGLICAMPIFISAARQHRIGRLAKVKTGLGGLKRGGAKAAEGGAEIWKNARRKSLNCDRGSIHHRPQLSDPLCDLSASAFRFKPNQTLTDRPDPATTRSSSHHER